LRAQLEDGSELGAVDAGVTYKSQELHLFLQQPGLFVQRCLERPVDLQARRY
jgi:hypothetical protein